MNQGSFVFLDRAGVRWYWLRIVTVFLILAVFSAFVVFMRVILVTPRLGEADELTRQTSNLRALIESEREHASDSASLPPAWLIAQAKSRPPALSAPLYRKRATDMHSPPQVEQTIDKQGLATSSSVRLGYYVDWDHNSLLSLKANARHLTHVAPEWLTLRGVDAEIIESRLNTEYLATVDEFDLRSFPILSNLHNNAWQPEAVEHLIRSPNEEQRAFAQAVAAKLLSAGADGVLVDFQQIDRSYRSGLTELFACISDVLHSSGLELWLSVPVGNDVGIFDLDSLATSVDRFVAMLYDETGEQDQPGSIASQEWFSEWLEVLVDHASSEQWVIGLGAYGYDWPARTKMGGVGHIEGDAVVTDRAAIISFSDAMSRAALAGEGSISYKTPYRGLHFAYTDRAGSQGGAHYVWFLDAITLRNQMVAAQRRGVGGYAIYRLGTEDPHVWQVFGQDVDCSNNCRPDSFQDIVQVDTLSDLGQGDFLSVSNEPTSGWRNVNLTADGYWQSSYIRYPKYPLVTHQGQADPNAVSLTFDDGPDPEWTPRILDILRDYKVPAAFFIAGAQAASYPSLLRRIVAEGHEVGNHTYYHPNLGEVSEKRIQLEVNATQRLLESVTGYSTILFRPPYNADRRPQSAAEFLSLLAVQNLGYFTVSASIDGEDWASKDAEHIFAKVKEGRDYGNVILLHDAGGDREATIEALPRIIEHLRKRGDMFVSLSSLIDVPRTIVMPPVNNTAASRSSLVAKTGFRVMFAVEEMLWAFMIASTIIILLRSFVVAILALLHSRRRRASGIVFDNREWKGVEREHAGAANHIYPPVSVLIAAYNEECVIANTLQALLASDYPNIKEIIVVDDGSQDSTLNVVQAFAAQHAGRVMINCVSQENLGKAAALQNGVAHVTTGFCVMLDADTQFQSFTISKLMEAFLDTNVGAVSGHARVGNCRRFLGKCQFLEYVSGFNLDRRAYDVWNCVTVVPGAVSAFRMDALQDVGGIPNGTLAEDTDLTLYLHRLGYRIAYAPEAVALTEVPETIAGLAKQRARWAFGTLQCIWKHRDMTFNPAFGALGFFSLPSIWFCHVFLVALIPLVDVMLIASLWTGAGMAIVDYVVVFISVDLLLAVLACYIEGVRLRWALLVLPMRFVYRPILAYAVWTAIIRALKGALVGWGKLERRGTVAVSGMLDTSVSVQGG